MSIKLKIAEETLICYGCENAILPGDKYWECTTPGTSLMSIEHTNCELYTDEYVKRQKRFKNHDEK